MKISTSLHRFTFFLLLCWSSLGRLGSLCAGELPKGFVYLDREIPGIVLEIRYAGSHNFVGEPVDGYHAPKAILSVEAATALKAVQADLKNYGLGLKVFDAYRPQRAVDHFVRWAKDLSDTKTKAEFYPNVPKDKLFEKEYIAGKSGHSRGSTADVTLVSLDDPAAPVELDMGSPFDYFDPASWPDYKGVTAQQRANRALLRFAMLKHGFSPYAQEWWHFRLAKEPYPETCFDFPVE